MRASTPTSVTIIPEKECPMSTVRPGCAAIACRALRRLMQRGQKVLHAGTVGDQEAGKGAFCPFVRKNSSVHSTAGRDLANRKTARRTIDLALPIQQLLNSSTICDAEAGCARTYGRRTFEREQSETLIGQYPITLARRFLISHFVQTG
jgi:hypothetical protein